MRLRFWGLQCIIGLVMGGMAFAGPHRRVALTFDDGPFPGSTESLLTILRGENVRATFFVVGRSCVLRPDLLRAIVADGHEVGNHSYSHLRLDTLTDTQIQLELQATSALITQYSGCKVLYFRPPGGRLSSIGERLAKAQHLDQIRWTLNAGDAEMDIPDLSAHRLLTLTPSVQDGAIILLHNGSEQTLVDLAAFIQGLKARGFGFVTVSELRHDH